MGYYMTSPDDEMPADALGWDNDAVAEYRPVPFLDSARVAAETLRRAFAPWEPSDAAPVAHTPRRSVIARLRSFFTQEER